MEYTAIEDFQGFRARHSSALSKESISRPPSIRPQETPLQSIEREYDDTSSLPESARHSSGPEEAVFEPSSLSRHSSPRTSHHSDESESVSSFFSGSRDPSCPPDLLPSSPCTPMKNPSPFRNPSSVRAMQMETTPPPYIPSAFHQRGMSPTSSRHSTPRSLRNNDRGSRTSPSKMSPIKKSSLKKEYPLVLLHVTLLPIPRVYSTELMEQVLPNYILENWKILREKATDTVIERGILIPHPKEDYDLMEERLLESLDLKTPRILKCGHFHLDPDEERDVAVPDEEDLDDEDNDADICADCGRRVRDGRYGSGAGSRRWDIKVYAANGLMKAGAWSAAWREMERVDVEITPWMADEFKRELVLRAEEERKHDALVQEEVLAREVQRPTIDEERMREIYGDDLPVFDKENEDPTMSAQSTRSVHGQPNEIPLRDLLKEYLVAAAQDRKNIAILLLSIFVLHLSIASMRSPKPSIASHQPFLSSPDWSILTSSTSMLDTGGNIPPASESPTTEHLEVPTISATPQREDAATSSPPAAQPSEDTVDSIEARFEFAEE